MRFHLTETEGRARTGAFDTAHGRVETPAFMPVGTQGSVKAVEHRELEEIGVQIILGNTYHLYLRPGPDVVGKAGGLHAFTGWNGPILTDSGGYQVFSLTELRTIEENGVRFRSHLDGSEHMFTPESVVDIQRALGSDIMMVLDECPPYPSAFEYAKESNELTLRWARRCREHAERQGPMHGQRQDLFGIVQGGTHAELRERSALELVEMDFDGYALGGLAVGEPPEAMYEVVERCESILPAEKPRYLMGVGTPENLLEAIDRGMDMFDCVMPTRNARNGMLFTRNGSLNIRNAMFKADFSPIDSECGCYTCSRHTRAYLRHLFQAKEILALQLATLHNLFFYLGLMRDARDSILNHTFSEWKRTQLQRMNKQSALHTESGRSI
ncbi:MAG: tRNA guanosine(34) transglycosylase Tgt [Bacteroidota bacterium]